MKDYYIVVPDQIAANQIVFMIKHHELFEKATFIKQVKAFPEHPTDPRINIFFKGQAKDFHALKAASWLAFRVDKWKSN